VITGLLLFSGAAFVSGEEPEALRWNPSLSMQFRAVQGTAISPGGSRVAFVVREPLMEGKKSEYLSHIWMAQADGSSVHQFTRGEKSATSPAFSPDGQWLAFASSRGPGEKSKTQVWLIRVAGGEAQQATTAENGVGSFRWSPDGSRIAFVMRNPETAEEKKDKEEKRDVILADQDFKHGHLYVTRVAPDASEIPSSIRLTGGEFHVTGFDWSPQGDEIVFAHQSDPRINTGRRNGDISIVTVPNADELLEIEAARKQKEEESEEGDEGDSEEPEETAGTVTELVAGAGVESNPRWSPDGRWIAHVSTGDQPEPIGLGDLFLIAAEGGDRRQLVEIPNRSANIVSWSGDRRSLFPSELQGTTTHVIEVPIEGDQVRQVSSGAGVVGSVSIDPTGDHMAFTWQTTEQPWDVFVSSTASFAPMRLTELHAAIEQPPMGRTELLSWAAPDGTPVEGLLTYPVGHREGDRVPLILNVHGGPAGVFRQNFTGGPSIYMLQYFAQEGFAILRPNPRGSTGYGKDFRYANFKDWGFGDLSDLLSGVDLVVEMGVGDPERLLRMGWSYGGYMTSFAVTQTNRFKAASMGAGLPNLVSMVTTTDIQDYLVAHMGGEFWDDYATYEKHSAIYQIKSVVTPTQVIHGAHDIRVPFTQGQEFYRTLGRMGVPTEMIIYPRTPHGPREPKFLMDVSDRILTWFRQHLP
jgi:dipeptidyl aminopeptidase/acylaminoacyl peptidase